MKTKKRKSGGNHKVAFKKERTKHSSKTKKAIKRQSKRTTLKQLQCSPLGRQDQSKLPTCFTDEQLGSLQRMWNARHPDAIISDTTPTGIWHALQDRYKGMCDSERCWIHRITAAERSAKRRTIIFTKKNSRCAKSLIESFAPNAPDSWVKNPNEWLSSVDISKVMKQYEKRYKCFEFIGPSPIDYSAVTVAGSGFTSSHVWPELRQFNIDLYINRGKPKIGIIFNLDPHTKSGSHWVSMFINTNKKQIVYFDSTGDVIPARLEKFVKKIQIQHPNYTFGQNAPHAHQHGDTECGIYALYFIIHMLEDKTTLKYLQTHSLSDAYIQRFRKLYFNVG